MPRQHSFVGIDFASLVGFFGSLAPTKGEINKFSRDV